MKKQLRGKRDERREELSKYWAGSPNRIMRILEGLQGEPHCVPRRTILVIRNELFRLAAHFMDVGREMFIEQVGKEILKGRLDIRVIKSRRPNK